MAFDFRRKSDVKLVAGATVAVLLVGFFIAAAMIVTTRGGNGPYCGQLNLGLAASVRDNLGNGPYFQSGGGDCGFWLALDNDDIVSYKALQPTCTLNWKADHWECGGNTVPAGQLEQYPTSIQTRKGIDVLIINLGAPAPSDTTT